MEHKKIKLRILSAVFALTLLISILPAARAAIKKETHSPFITTFSKTELPGAVVTFSSEDFASRLAGSDKLEGIVINELPPAECGVLKSAGTPIANGEGLSASAIDTLSFEPAEGANIVHTTFSFIPVFKEYGAGDKSVLISINLDEKQNGAPIATNMECETYKNLELRAEFETTDPDGDTCEFTIVNAPKKGEIEILGNVFVYKPKPDETYRDTFTYCAIDANGNASNPASVKITVKKRPDKEAISYADLAQSTAHYSAIKLAEAGVFKGESIGGNYFLSPEKEVTRAEFISMVMAASDVAIPTAAIPSGLIDDAQTPQWAKAASAAALNAGIVEGSPNFKGSRELRAQEPITVAEAITILDRAAKMPSSELKASFSDNASIPEWASDAINKAANSGVINAADGAAHPNDVVTRADAVEMIYNAAKCAKDGVLSLDK